MNPTNHESTRGCCLQCLQPIAHLGTNVHQEHLFFGVDPDWLANGTFWSVCQARLDSSDRDLENWTPSFLQDAPA